MTDKNKDMDESVKEFVAEAEEIIAQLNSDMLKLEGPGKASPDVINSVFRSAHTLKGMSGMFGYEPMVKLSHNLEELLDGLRLGRSEMTPYVLDVLLEAVSVIQMLLDAKSRGEDFSISIDDVSAKIKKAMQQGQPQSDGAGEDLSSKVDNSILNVLTEYEEHRLSSCLKENMHILKVQASFPIVTFDQGLDELSSILKQSGEIITTLPSPGSTPGETIDFDIIVATRIRKDDLDRAIDNRNVKITSAIKEKAGAEKRAAAEPVGTASELAPGGAEAVAAAPTAASEEAFKTIARTVRVDISMLDNLMNIVGELSIIKAQIGGAVDSVKIKSINVDLAAALSKAHTHFDKKLSELQQGLLEARMVPLSQVFEKLARTVRKTARELGKDVTFEVRGEETKLDKLIVEELGSPLIHIIRNSLDHGIETPDERAKSGKSPKGVILANAYQRGNHVIIEVSDDGRGINTEKILKKAVSMGLVEHGSRPKKEDILNFMFLPGFSTSDKVSEISGRGVGMDVVKANISALSGMVNIESSLGRGTKIMLILPMTLAIIRALVADASGRRYAIPLTSIVETFILEPSHVETVEGREYVHLRDSNIPLVKLKNFLSIPGNEGKNKYVVVVGLAEKKIGIIVDSLKGQQDIVIKSIGKRLKGVNIFAGAADYKQETILVLDVGGIIEECAGGQVAQSVT